MRVTSNRLCTAVAAAMLVSAPLSHAQLEEVIVTATKVESSIQDTPIAVSAFTQDQLDSQLINDTMNLQFSVPNMTMSKQNFTANDIRIRGIGAGAIGPAGDTGVGIHINGVYQTSSRIFEAQYFDTERVEVLRGPQGTLYGRNTTGGVVNVITGKADPSEFSAKIDGTVGNYSYRQVRGMINAPLGDNFAVRVAGMGLNRDGFIENVYDGEDVDNRDMWAGRLSLTWTPSDNTEISFMYSKFEEDDNRVRSQKQACVYDPTGVLGCLPGKPQYQQANTAGSITGALMTLTGQLNAISQGYLFQVGQATGNPAYLGLGAGLATGAVLFPAEDYIGDTNPDGVRQVNMDFKPQYETDEETFQFHVSHDFGNLQLYYSGGLSETSVTSQEDYEKGVANADWTPTLNTLAALGSVPALPASMAGDVAAALAPYGPTVQALVPAFITSAVTGIDGVGIWAGNPMLQSLANGIPVLGGDDQSYFYAFNGGGYDESSNDNKQWTHEIRLQSSFDGPLNFLLGGFYLDFDNTNAYIVRTPGLALPGMLVPVAPAPNTLNPAVYPAPIGDPDNPRSESDPYMQGYHNDSRVYKLDAKAIFGEVYWDVTDSLRLTFGGRYTEEEKYGKQRTIYVTFLDLPQVQPNNAFFDANFEQEEFSWKVNATWNMSDNTMMYATASSSFKSGGFNPISDNSPLLTPAFGGNPNNAYFDAEFVDAYEIGLKTTLFGGSMQVNAAGFYYDYADFQQSQIVNVTSKNVNADAEITGIELDVLWAITPNLIASFSGGWLDTEIGEFWSVDTANPNATPQSVLATDPVRATDGVVSVNGVNFIENADYSRCEVIAPVPCYGYMQNQKGNQIAGSPELNYNIGLAWTLPLGSMDLTLSTNYYWQDEFYASNFNNISNKVDDWSMWNASARVSGERWYAEAWVKNIEDNDNVTGHYLTSSVSALFTNQFILDPQTYGVSVGYKF